MAWTSRSSLNLVELRGQSHAHFGEANSQDRSTEMRFCRRVPQLPTQNPLQLVLRGRRMCIVFAPAGCQTRAQYGRSRTGLCETRSWYMPPPPKETQPRSSQPIRATHCYIGTLQSIRSWCWYSNSLPHHCSRLKCTSSSYSLRRPNQIGVSVTLSIVPRLDHLTWSQPTGFVLRSGFCRGGYKSRSQEERERCRLRKSTASVAYWSSLDETPLPH